MPTVTDPKSKPPGRESDDDAPELLSGPSMGADGRMERFARMEAPVPIQQSSRPEPIELSPIPPPPVQQRLERYRNELTTRAERSRSNAAKFVIALVVLAVAGTIGVVVVKPQLSLPAASDGVNEPSLLDQLNVGERSPMIISSEPSGAKVIIAGEPVGETPWAGDNRWHGKTKLRIYVPGYKPWDGEFDGDAPVTLDVKLKR